MKKAVKILSLVLLFASGTGVLVFVAAGLFPERRQTTPAGFRVHQSVYVTMGDGTALALRVSLPSDLQENEGIPAIMETSRYGTDYKRTFLLNGLVNLGIGKVRESIFFQMLAEARYALVRVDARGTGASFGNREMEWSKEEIYDMDTIIDWIAEQPWSNGKVGTYGVSYSGNTAELAMVSNNRALLAAAPLYPDFNPLKQSAFPGGIFNEVLMECFVTTDEILDANKTDIFNGGIAPVDGDRNGQLLKKILAQRDNKDVFACLQKMTYFDDFLTDEIVAASLCPFTYKNEIEESEVPLYVRVGWHDAGTVNGALERFLTYKNHQELVIGPWSHGGSYFFDPFVENPSDPEGIIVRRDQLETAQSEELIRFFDTYLKRKTKEHPENSIFYYTLGEGKWKRTATWPVKGFDHHRLYFDRENRLSFESPRDGTGSDLYDVDFSASTGTGNRWYTNIGGGPISYPDRAEEDRKLLCYTTAPLGQDWEITGAPVVSLNLSVNTTDGAVYVYLEDVAPDGKVTYLTEGELRLIHRNETEEDLGYASLGTRHSFKAEDGRAVVPNENFSVRIQMYALSVLLKKGHRLRVAIAGHDRANFRRIPENKEDVTLCIQRNSMLSSYIDLPLQVREPD